MILLSNLNEPIVAARLYRAGDLVYVKHKDREMFMPCPPGQAVVMKASGLHSVKLSSMGGSLPPGATPYYQILKVMAAGRSYYNVHSHNVRLLSGNENS
jgi:hypothetical protein